MMTLGRVILLVLAAVCMCVVHAADADYARIEREVAASDRAITEGQAALKDRVSLADYADRVRRVDGREIWTAAFQAALDGHEIVVVPAREEKYWLDATVVVPSRRRIEATGATVALAPGVKTVMLRNAHVVDGTLAPVPSGSRDRDIAVVGGRWEDNCTSRAGYGRSGMFNLEPRQVGNWYGVSTLFLFCNVDRFSVRDATFVRCGGFAVQSAEGDGRLFRGIRFDCCFADGLHLNGNLTHVHAADVRGKVGDDLVALNAYDWLNSSICFGPQRFVLCEDLELNLKEGQGYPAIRIQPAVYRYRDGTKVDCRISDVIFRRVKGITTYKMYLQTPAYTVGREPEWGEVGSGGNLFFEDLDIDLDRPIDMLGEYAASQAPRGHFGAFEFGANLSDVTIRNVRIAFHADRWPLTHLVCVGPKSCTGRKADGSATEYFDPYVSCTVGTVRVENLTVRGVPPRDLVHVSSFADVNGDGRSTGRGTIGTVKFDHLAGAALPDGFFERRPDAPATVDAADFESLRRTYSFFDDDVHPLGEETRRIDGHDVRIRRFERNSTPVFIVALADGSSGDAVTLDLRELGVKGDFVRVDLATGAIGILPSLESVSVGTSPELIARNPQVPRQTVWAEMSPEDIVTALCRPWQKVGLGRYSATIKMDVSSEPWTQMDTKDFLPCFDRYGQFKWRDWPGKTHSDAELKSGMEAEERDLAAHPGPRNRNRFGGWSDGPQLKATGRFRTEKVNGKWWLVDPEGRLFWSWGPVRVTPSSAMTPLNGNPRAPRVGGDLPDRDCLFAELPEKGTPLAAFYETCDEMLRHAFLVRDETRWYDFSAANLYRKYGADWFARYADSCHRRLRSWGCNTIANSSDLKICLMDRTPYAERVETRSFPIAGSWGNWNKFRDPFHPSFAEGCRKGLEAHGREAHDPWCIGFFIDNEINWGDKPTDLAQWTLWSPDDQPAKVEFVRRLKAKGIDPAKDEVPDSELEAFTAVLVDEYFRRTREAVKAFDPGLLYLGCRFANTARPWVIASCVKHCDVVSYNLYYDRIDDWRLPQDLDAPVMVGEFHFGAHDRGLFGAGLKPRPNQVARAAALKGYVASALANPQIVGVHWHQFSDQATSGRFDGEYYQVGWTDICDRPYPETVEVLRALDIYALR